MVDGAICPHAELQRLVARLQPVVAAMDAEDTPQGPTSNRPTYFEIITALALLRFVECQVDAAVLEVGLGGRLDSTNVCHPLVTVITSISFDHTQQLGTTLAAIAGEKAGIIKSQTPVVSGVLPSEPRAVMARVAREHECPLVQMGTDFHYEYHAPRHLETAAEPARMDFHYRVAGGEFDLNDVELQLIGEHQAANAAVGVATLCELRRLGWNIPDSAVRQGLAAVRWPARIEVIRRLPAVVLDAAHNVASIEALVQVLDESFSVRRRVLVFATTRDKDVRGMLGALLGKFDEIIFSRYHNNPRGMPVEELSRIAAELAPTVEPHVCPDAESAWQLAARLATRDDLICITGSFFTAAEMRGVIEQGG